MDRQMFRVRRDAQKLTLREITRKLEQHGIEVTEATVGMWDRGETFPTPDKWIAVMAVYGLTQKQLSSAAMAFKRPTATAAT